MLLIALVSSFRVIRVRATQSALVFWGFHRWLDAMVGTATR